MLFPHLHWLAGDWKKDNLTLEGNTIFRKKRSYTFKKVLRCVRFQNA